MTILRAQSLPVSQVATATSSAQSRSRGQTYTTQRSAQTRLRAQETGQSDVSKERLQKRSMATSTEAETATSSKEASLLDEDAWASSITSCLVPASLAVAPLLIAGPALAYNRTETEGVLKNVAGAAYALLLCVYFYRLFRRRAKSGTSQNMRALPLEEEEKQPLETLQPPIEADVTPAGALWGAFQAGAICYILFQLCGQIEAYFARQEIPPGYTAHQITVTLRTVIQGLAYLLTFLFGANCAGLTGFAFQLIFFPGSLQEKPTEQEKQS